MGLGCDHAWRSRIEIWWVPEELNLSTPAARFHSRPGYSRLSGKGPVLAVRFERTLERVLGSPPLPLGYASVVPSGVDGGGADACVAHPLLHKIERYPGLQ